MGCKIEVQEALSHKLIFAKQFLRPHQSGAHGTSHACHTLDLPLHAIHLWKVINLNICLPED